MCIPTRGRPEELARALASIGRSTYPVAQVVVSDDLADSIAEGICRDAPVEVDYVRGPGRGVGANRNRAVAEARSEIVAFLDDDGVLLPDFLETAVARMRTGEQRYGFGRVIVSGCVVTQHGELIPAHEQTFLGYQAKPLATSEGLRTLAMNAVIVPIHVFREVQFDPQLVYGYEEVDLAIRAAAAGYVIVDCPEAQNFHESETPLRDYHDRYAEASRLHVTLRRDLYRAVSVARTGLRGHRPSSRHRRGPEAAWSARRAPERGNARTRGEDVVACPAEDGAVSADVSVVITTYRRPERLAGCLDGVRAQTRPADEVVVVVHSNDRASIGHVEESAGQLARAALGAGRQSGIAGGAQLRSRGGAEVDCRVCR